MRICLCDNFAISIQFSLELVVIKSSLPNTFRQEFSQANPNSSVHLLLLGAKLIIAQMRANAGDRQGIVPPLNPFICCVQPVGLVSICKVFAVAAREAMRHLSPSLISSALVPASSSLGVTE